MANRRLSDRVECDAMAALRVGMERRRNVLKCPVDRAGESGR